MKKKNTFILIIIIIIAIIGVTTFLTQKKDQTFAEAAGLPEDASLVYHQLGILKDLNGNLEEVRLTDNEKTKLTELLNTTKVDAKPVKYPPVPLLFVDQKVRDTQGHQFNYYIYNAEDGNTYVYFHNSNKYFKIFDTSIRDFYNEVYEREYEKAPQ